MAAENKGAAGAKAQGAKAGGKKSGAPKIQGAIRLGDVVYVAGQEEELHTAMKEAGIDKVRGFGVDSTDISTARGGQSSERQKEIAARSAKAEREASGEDDGEGDEEGADDAPATGTGATGPGAGRTDAPADGRTTGV